MREADHVLLSTSEKQLTLKLAFELEDQSRDVGENGLYFEAVSKRLREYQSAN